jgi:hypothetical protein
LIWAGEVAGGSLPASLGSSGAFFLPAPLPVLVTSFFFLQDCSLISYFLQDCSLIS